MQKELGRYLLPVSRKKHKTVRHSQGTEKFPFSYFANPTLKLIKVIKDIKNINTFDKTRTHGQIIT